MDTRTSSCSFRHCGSHSGPNSCQVVPLPYQYQQTPCQCAPCSPLVYHPPFGCVQSPAQSPCSSHYPPALSPLLQSSNHTHLQLQSPNHTHLQLQSPNHTHLQLQSPSHTHQSCSHSHPNMHSSSSTHFHSPSPAHFCNSSSTPLLSPIPSTNKRKRYRPVNNKENLNTITNQIITATEKHKRLDEWSLKVVENCLVAEGITSGKRKHSGRVTRVHPPRTLITASGSVYTLTGPPSVLLKYSFNLSDEDFWLFSDGLPNRWKSLIANERIDVEDERISGYDSTSDDAEEPLVNRKRGREEHTKRDKGNDTMNNSCQPGSHNLILTKRKNIQQWASVVTTSCTSMVTTPCTEVPVKCSTPCVKDFSILASPVSVKSERNKSFIHSITPSNKRVKVSPVSFSTPSLTYSQSFLSSLKRSSSGRLLKPVSHRLTDRFVSYSYSTKGELLGVNSSPMIDLTINPTVNITKLDLSKQENYKFVVNTPVHKSTTIQTKEAELDSLANNNGRVSAILPPKQMERVEHGCQDQSNKTHVLIKPKRKRKKLHVCYPKFKAPKKSDAVKNERNDQAPNKVVNGEGPCQKKEEYVPPRTGSPLQNNWTNGDDFKLSRAVMSVPVISENFWELICKKFGGKFTAKDCQEHYMEMGKRPVRQLRKRIGKTTSSEPKEGVITGRVGTIKRQKQLRGVLKSIDSGYHDNLLDSTPIQKKTQHITVTVPENVEHFSSEKSMEGEEGVAAVGSNGYKKRMEGPQSHTPQLNHYLTTDDLDMLGTDADRVVYRYRNTKHLPNDDKRPAKSAANLGSVPLVNKRSNIFNTRDLTGIRTSQRSLFKLFSDSEEDSCEDEELTDEIEEKCQLVLGYLD